MQRKCDGTFVSVRGVVTIMSLLYTEHSRRSMGEESPHAGCRGRSPVGFEDEVPRSQKQHSKIKLKIVENAQYIKYSRILILPTSRLAKLKKLEYMRKINRRHVEFLIFLKF